MLSPFELRRTARARWLGAFVAGGAPAAHQEPPFPILGGSHTPADWVIDQFLQRADDDALRENIRETVVELIRTHGGSVGDDERDQVVGLLLHVAGELNFVEIKTALAGWVRSGWINHKHVYYIGSLELPLRRLVWSLLIGWDYLDDLGPQLVRDLKILAQGGETGTAQSCFVALGQRDPATALELIPRIRNWHRTYFTTAVLNFFRSVGPDTLVMTKYRHAWAACLGPCLFDPAIYRSLRTLPPLHESDSSRPNELVKLLNAVGIRVRWNSTTVYLSIDRQEELKVDVRPHTNRMGATPSRGKPVPLYDWPKQVSHL